MDQLILKYITQELREDEALLLKEWLEADPLNRETFENIVGIKDISEGDIQSAKARIDQVLSQQTNPGSLSINHKSGHKRYWSGARRFAAVIIVALISYGLTYSYLATKDEPVSYQKIVTYERETPLGKKLSFQLPDGTMVKLNSGSKLTYLENDSIEERKVELVGEAYFEVARDEDRPFIISAKSLNIQVLGTSFNVKSFPDEKNSTVAVTSGSVAVSDIFQRFIPKNLLPGQMINFSETGQVELSDFDVNEQLCWKDNTLCFKDVSLEEVVSRLNRWYGVAFTIKKTKGIERKITGNYKQASLEEVLHSLSVAYGFTYEQREKHVIIND